MRMTFIRWLHLWRQRPAALPMEQENLLEDVLLRVLASIDSRLGASGHRFPARTVLLALYSSFLVDIDQGMRSPRRPRGDDLPEDLLDRASRPDIDDATREACQFLLTMHWSGRLRERALRAMEPGGSRLALAASLLRCADWVDPIRHVATDMTARLLDRSTDDDVFALMPLIYRMRGHIRFPHDRLDPKLEAWLTSSDARLERALTSFVPLKRWALRFLFEQRAPVEARVLEQAIADPDPTIPIIVFERLAELPVASRAIVMASGLRAKHPLVRQYALRAIARDVSRVPLKGLHRALIDRSAGMRSFAGHTLRTQYHDDPVAFWRGLVDAGTAPWSAYLSLAEHSTADDESRLRRALVHPFARVRAAALLALMRLGMRATDAEFVRFASDPSPRVRRVLAGFCRSGDIPLGNHRLRLLWTALPNSATGPAGELLDALPAGERLDLLFAFEPTTDVERRWWNGMLAVWSDSALGWWETEPALRARLAELLARRSSVLDLPLRIRLEKGAAR